MKVLFLVAVLAVSSTVAQAGKLDPESEVVYESHFTPYTRCDGVTIVDGTIDDPTYSGLVSFTIHGGLTFVERYELGVAVSYSYLSGEFEGQAVDEDWVEFLGPEDEIYEIRDDFLSANGYAAWDYYPEDSDFCKNISQVAEAEMPAFEPEDTQ